MSATLEIRAVLKDEFEAAARRMIAELTAIGSAGSSAGASLRMGMSSTLPTVEAVNESLGRNNAQLRAQIAAYKSPEGAQYLAQQKRLREEIDEITSSTEKQSMTWANIASKYYMVSQALGAVARSTMVVVDATAKYELIAKRLAAVEGSEIGGQRDLEAVQVLAKAPGLSFETAANTMATLRSMKISAREAQGIISGIAAANASAAGTAEQFGNVMYQIQQSISLGKLMQEDLRPILQQIPTLGAAIRQEFGSGNAEGINKYLEKNKMSIEEFWEKVAEIGSKMPKAGETISNNLDNIGDAWTRLMASFGKSVPIKEATGLIATMVEKMAKVSEDIQSGKLQLIGYKGRIAISEGTAVNPTEGGNRGETSTEMLERIQKGAKAKTQGQIEAEEKEAKKIAAARDKMDDMEVERVNRRNAELVEHRAALAEKLTATRIKEDKSADDKYWKDQEESLADWKKTFNATQKQKFSSYKENEERITRQEQAEWEKRSQLAIHYADTLSSTMESAYTDIFVNGRDVFDSLYDAFSEMLTKMALEMAAKATIFEIFSAFGGGGLLGGAGSFIFGARASGGAVFPGMTYRRNEDAYGGGGEPFRPSTSGTIMPNRSSTGSGSGGGGDVHYHFAAGISRSDAGYIVRAIQQGTKERRRTVSRIL